MVYRLGGDEFAVVQRSVQYPDDSTALANRIIAAISAPYEIDGHSVQIGVSIGVALCSPDESDAEALLRAADMALYEAKAQGRGNLRVFRPEIQQERLRRRAIEVDLREAVARRELMLLFQPIVRVADRRIVGAEALIRWRHPSLGLLAPEHFIPIAEEAGLISPIDAWALQKACVKAATWPEPVGLSVNLSPLQFAGAGLVEATRSALKAAGLPPSRLTLEVTETALLHDDPHTQETVTSLRALGVTIAMDDFGTGYSSLSYLRHFEIARIKIDRTFTQSVDSQNASRVIVGAIVAIGAGLGIAVCAEGVETAEQLAAVARLGAQEAQGFFLHRPMPSREFAALLSQQRASGASQSALGKE
jgi:predicted signal transduction protein with EAL and GGDEF domain